MSSILMFRFKYTFIKDDIYGYFLPNIAPQSVKFVINVLLHAVYLQLLRLHNVKLLAMTKHNQTTAKIF